MALTKETEKQIVALHIRELEQAIYSQVIRKRVADKCHDTQINEACVKELEKLEKMRDAYLEIEKESP
jgi:hypothetical protein